MATEFPCWVCGKDMGFDAPSGVCSSTCLRNGQNGQTIHSKGIMKPTDNSADICFYGSATAGYGWIASTNQRTHGTGELLYSSLTAALWVSTDQIQKILGGPVNVRVFAPGGERVATFNTHNRGALFCWGDLRWSPAPIVEISVADLIAESERQAAERQAANHS